jgi:hypothetical protein
MNSIAFYSISLVCLSVLGASAGCSAILGLEDGKEKRYAGNGGGGDDGGDGGDGA